MMWEMKYPSDRPVTFTSDYRKVSVRKEDILYIATMASPESVRVAGKELPVSRKYKDVVSTMLTQ